MKKKKNLEGEGAWIFVSHSHKDINKVRFIRNEFEKRGHNPLLFFLKCLNDEDELDDLIKREITERNWFILCDSPNARASKWVQSEVEIIKSLEGKVFETIDLNDDIEIQLEKITNFSKRTNVFLSYMMKDKEIGDKIINKLKKYDFGVFEYKNIESFAMQLDENMHSAIDDVLQKGFFLILISQETFNSKYMINEVLYALQKNVKSIIPILINDDIYRKLNIQSLGFIHYNYNRKQVLKVLSSTKAFTLDQKNLDVSIEELVKYLKMLEL